MIWILIVLVLILLILWWGKQPNYYRDIAIDDFKRFIRGLIVQGNDGSLLFIEHQGSKKFIQYAKFKADDFDDIINFGFPDAQWSRIYFQQLAKALQNEGIPFEICGTGEEADLVPRFIEIDKKVENIDKTAEELSHIGKLAFKVMGIEDKEKFRIRYEGGLRINTC